MAGKIRTMGEQVPYVSNRDVMLACDGDIITSKQQILKECNCVKRSTCAKLMELMHNNKVEEARNITRVFDTKVVV